MPKASAKPAGPSPAQIISAFGQRSDFVDGIDDDPTVEFDAAKRWIVATAATLSMYGGPVRFSAGQIIVDLALARELRQGGIDIRPYIGAR